jgi:hypothetical protein
MNDWIIFAVGCYATVLCLIATAVLVYAVNSDGND